VTRQDQGDNWLVGETFQQAIIIGLSQMLPIMLRHQFPGRPEHFQLRDLQTGIFVMGQNRPDQVALKRIRFDQDQGLLNGIEVDHG